MPVPSLHSEPRLLLPMRLIASLVLPGRPRRLATLVPAVLAVALSSCAPPARPRPVVEPEGPPPVQREFRGVWVATVGNIDWPSRPGLPADSQRAELVALLDSAAAMRLNAIVLQVRPAADALYPSELEPWSEYLTGAQGRPPEPFYDPLKFAVDEAHRRGLELHAWFNPYRARHSSAKSPAAPSHISRARPDLVREYGGFLWMDPGEPEVQERSLQVMLDVVRRYDVDGVHIDDYFYPYPEQDSAGRTIDFPDEPSWRRYVASGGKLSRGDWRRENVNQFVRRLNREVHREKSWVKVGISPFGIWRPNHPREVGPAAFDQYDRLYADARLWVREGWADYFSPQLYWPIAMTDRSYPILLDWWVRQNRSGRHMWPGLFTSRTFDAQPRPWPAREILGQVYVTRGRPGATGNVHFSAKAFLLNPDSLFQKMRGEAYREPALVPASPWLGSGRPGRPSVRATRGSAGRVEVALEPAGRTPPAWWVVQVRRGTTWTTEILPGAQRSAVLTPRPAAGSSAAASEADEVVAAAVDRVGNESATVRIVLP